MTSNILTQERLKELLHYDSNTGVFTRNITVSSNAIGGNEAGCLCKLTSYILLQLDGRLYRAHRLAWLYVYGELPKNDIDHINHIRDDNRLNNLRSVTCGENNKNRPLYKKNKSGFAGVYWRESRNRWYAYIVVNRKKVHLGTFVEKNHAIISRWLAEDMYGFHKNHGAIQ